MKKPIKYAITGLIVLAGIAGSVYYMMSPVPVRMTPIVPRTAELTFTEQGIVTAENTVTVFAGVQGEINNIYAREGQIVRANDALLSIDDTVLRLRLEQVQSSINSLRAQLANAGVEDTARRREMQTARNSLQGELRAINAQAAESYRAFANHQEALDEQIRIQQILIDQHESELARVNENFLRVNTLYESGVASRSDFEAANSALVAAQTLLEAAQGQMAVIAAGTPQNSAEHFEGLRASINAQISGIDQQLAQDTITAAQAHFEALIAVEMSNMSQIEREIENSIITAPVSGIITEFHALNTNFINTAAPVAEITVFDSVTIDVYVSTQDINSIRIGEIVSLTLRQRMDDIEFLGRISGFGSAAVVRHTALGVEERKVNVQIEPIMDPIVADQNVLGLGYAVDVTFYVFREDNRIIVPRTAIFRDDGKDMVWLVRGSSDGTGPVQAAPVELGMELRTDIIIENGLNEGDFVVNDANNINLRNGVRVANER